MGKRWALGGCLLMLLAGCASPQRGAIPVVDSGVPVGRPAAVKPAPQPVPRPQPVIEQNVVVTPVGDVPPPLQVGGVVPGGPAPITPGPTTTDPTLANSWETPGTTTVVRTETVTPLPSGSLPASAAPLAGDEQLDGAVLALLTTAQQQQDGGNLNAASASLERAQRIAPREPQVLYRLAQVRLNQGDAPQAEQLARRALTYANGRPQLQASLWELIAQSREKQGDPSGAQQARQRAGGSA